MRYVITNDPARRRAVVHRPDGCHRIRVARDVREATEVEARVARKCFFCFPSDPVKALLARVAEEERLNRKAQRLAEETTPAVLALFEQLKGE